MPTPAVTGQAVLQPINLTAPGHLGLNTEQALSILGPEWATLTTNAVFDASNRLAVRKGWQSITASAVAGVIQRVHEYIKADGTAEIITSTDADIFSGDEPSSIEGSLGISEGNIRFVNFNDKCIALGTGTSSNPSVYTGTGNFTTVTVNSGTAPTSGTGTAAFGRLWVVDSDGKTIRYSALLDETRWDSADGGGTIDMSKVWVAGQDEVVAIREFAGDLIVFGKNQIIFWTDAVATDLGIDPLTLHISDSIVGTGAITQFGITEVEGDLWFLSPSGVQSLVRARSERTTPIEAVTRNVQSTIAGYIAQIADFDDLTLVYSPSDNYCLAIFPALDKVMCIDSRAGRDANDRVVWRVTSWTTPLQTAAYRVSTQGLLGSITTTVGEVFTHTGNADDGASYSFAYESGWLDLGEQAAAYMKFVKKLTSVVFVEASTTLTYALQYDFNTNSRIIQVTAVGSAAAEFNLSEFTNSGAGIGYKVPSDITLGESEFSGGIALRTQTIPGQGGGQYIKVGVSLDNASAEFALQQVNLFAKLGRIANV